jgi:hypothetical protein
MPCKEEDPLSRARSKQEKSSKSAVFQVYLQVADQVFVKFASLAQGLLGNSFSVLGSYAGVKMIIGISCSDVIVAL